MEFPPHPFWDFSLKVYGARGVAPACLALQERHGIDVNIVLFCCWCGAAGYPPLDDADMRRVISAVSPWHDTVVRGLRAVRKSMKAGIDGAPADLGESLRRRIAATEIDCEHVEQLMLAALADDRSPVPETPRDFREHMAITNIVSYFNELDAGIDETDAAHFKTIAAAAINAIDATANS